MCTYGMPVQSLSPRRLSSPRPRMPSADGLRSPGDKRALRLFSKHIQKHGLVQRQIGDQAFQLGILVLKLLEPENLGNAHPSVDFLPTLERGFGNGPSCDRFLQPSLLPPPVSRQRRSARPKTVSLAYGHSSVPGIVPENSQSDRISFEGQDHALARVEGARRAQAKPRHFTNGMRARAGAEFAQDLSDMGFDSRCTDV